MKKYPIIYADPAWSFNNKNTGGSGKSGANAIYPVMTVQEICNLPISEIAADDCVLFCWWVASQPQEALDVVKAWGFTLKTMTGFDWIKLTRHGLPFFGMGFWTRQGSEHCIIATKGKPKRISASVRSCKALPIGRHSEKPDYFRKQIVELCGDIPRIELFCREKKEGWDGWGNEIVSDITL